MSETGEIAFDQAIADLSRIEKSASNIQAQVAELFPEEQQSQMAAHLVEFFPNPGHLLDKIKELGKEITNLNGTISDLKGTISGLEGTVSGLKGKVSDLESKVTSVGKQLESATKSLSELSNNVLEDAKKVEHRVVDFGKKLEGLAKDFSFGSEDGKKFVALLKSYYKIAMQAIQTLIKALESDIQNLVNIDRLTKLWNIVENVFDQLPKVGSLVVGIAKDAEKWTKTVFDHVQEK